MSTRWYEAKEKRGASLPVEAGMPADPDEGDAKAAFRKVVYAKGGLAAFDRDSYVSVMLHVDAKDMAARIRQGLPAGTFQRVRKSFGMIDMDEMLPIVGVSKRTLERRIKERKPLDPTTSDRLYRMAKIKARAVEVFEDEERAINWLHKPNRALQGATPIEMLDVEIGADKVERILGRIEHGVFG